MISSHHGLREFELYSIFLCTKCAVIMNISYFMVGGAGTSTPPLSTANSAATQQTHASIRLQRLRLLLAPPASMPVPKLLYQNKFNKRVQRTESGVDIFWFLAGEFYIAGVSLNAILTHHIPSTKCCNVIFAHGQKGVWAWQPFADYFCDSSDS